MSALTPATKPQAVTWDVLTPFWLRTTGFPFRWLHEIRLTDTLQALQSEGDMEAQLAELADRFFAALHDTVRTGLPASVKDRVRRAVKTRVNLDPFDAERVRQLPQGDAWVADWQKSTAAVAQCKAMTAAIFREELETARGSLWGKATDDRLREAVFLNSPTAYRNLTAAPREPGALPTRDHAIRKAERSLYSYVQRLCAKNDTVSFFGPVNFGEFNPADSADLSLDFTKGRTEAHREVAFAHWGVEALAKVVAGDPQVRPWAPVRISPLVRRLAPGRIHFHLVEREVALPERLDALLDGIDRFATASGLARATGRPLDDVLEDLQLLSSKRIVEWGFPLHPCTPQPLHHLQRQIHALPSAVAQRWEPVLTEIESLRRSFETAALTERIPLLNELEARTAAVTGGDGQRKAGEGYADRLLLTEDCRGEIIRLTMGGSLSGRVTAAMQTLMPVLLTAGQALRRDLQQAVRPVWERQAAGKSRVPYMTLIRALNDAVALSPPAGGAFGTLRQRLIETLQAAPDGRSALLSPASAANLAREFALPGGTRPDWLAMPSLDLMIASPSLEHLHRGDAQLVLGEIHDDASTIFGGYLSHFHPQPEQLLTVLDEHIRSRPGWEQMAFVISNRRHKHYGPELPGYTVELTASSAKPRQWVIPIAEVDVVDRDGELVLVTGDKPVYLWPGDVHDPAFLAFALPSVKPIPLELGSHTPRILVGDMVYQRERWSATSEEWTPPPGCSDGCDLLRHFRHLQHRYRMPDWVFLRYSSKEKPVLIDFANYFSLEQLVRYLKPGLRLTFSEMLPAPDQLWWPGHDGVKTCEFRMAVVPHCP